MYSIFLVYALLLLFFYDDFFCVEDEDIPFLVLRRQLNCIENNQKTVTYLLCARRLRTSELFHTRRQNSYLVFGV